MRSPNVEGTAGEDHDADEAEPASAQQGRRLIERGHFGSKSASDRRDSGGGVQGKWA